MEQLVSTRPRGITPSDELDIRALIELVRGLERALSDLDKRHRNLRANYLRHQLKLGRKLAKKERRLMVNLTGGKYAESAVEWYPEVNVSPTSSAHTETDSYGAKARVYGGFCQACDRDLLNCRCPEARPRMRALIEALDRIASGESFDAQTTAVLVLCDWGWKIKSAT